jgi:hypothetical protein
VLWPQYHSASSCPIQGHPVVYLIVWEPISVNPSMTSCWSQSRTRFWSPYQTQDQCNLSNCFYDW